MYKDIKCGFCDKRFKVHGYQVASILAKHLAKCHPDIWSEAHEIAQEVNQLHKKFNSLKTQSNLERFR